jgi:hypothetical protein
MVQDLPRLSTRSRLALFGEEAKKLEEHVHTRRTAYAEHCSKGTQLDFSIDQFVSKESVSSSETKKTRDNFRFFVEQVGAIADGSSQQQDAARTMYNIMIRKKDSKDIAYSDAVSYFGKISQTKFDLIRTAALDLLQAKERAAQLSSKTGITGIPIEKEFNPKLKFNIPELISDFYDNYNNVGINENVKGEDVKVVHTKNEEAKKLTQLCEDYVRKNNFTMGAQYLAAEVIKMLQTKGANSESIQIKLFELIGEEGFEFMFTIIEEMNNFKFISLKDLEDLQGGSAVSGNRGMGIMTSQTAFPPLQSSNIGIYHYKDFL